ncbi:sugar kinase [Arthrobacter oryzae]|uniref:Sugar kinase n=1 Tax=Arthrobacter oryzae TaxID=409290 RepID=A0A3N0BMW7_9MICC|nr:sugar kinase [Arthrobacter oryzae]RNL50045.1 sugar kinase [Arthrobacter oryzae]
MTGTGVVTIGETMVLVSSTIEEPLQHSKHMTLGIGGAESNVAIGLRRLGTDVTWIGKIGEDSAGDLVERELRAEGIQVVGIRDPDAPTALMLKERRSAAETRVWYYRAGNAGSRLGVNDLDPTLISGATLLHMTGITPALSESTRLLTLEAIRIARSAGVPVSFDLNYRKGLWSRDAAAEFYRQVVPLVDIVFAGDDEAAIAVGPAASPEELAQRLVDLGAGRAVIKLGADGALALAEGTITVQKAIPVTVRDTVGAGDAFVAGYLAEYLAGESVAACLETAVQVGAYACMAAGDWEGLPRRRELAALSASEPVSR